MSHEIALCMGSGFRAERAALTFHELKRSLPGVRIVDDKFVADSHD